MPLVYRFGDFGTSLAINYFCSNTPGKLLMLKQLFSSHKFTCQNLVLGKIIQVMVAVVTAIPEIK